MQKKTIRKVLIKKVNDWVKSVDDEEVKKAIRNNVIITGGAIVSMILRESPKDYDVYFKTKESLKIVLEYYSKKFNKDNSRDVEVREDGERLSLFVSSDGVASENKKVESETFEDVYDVLDVEHVEEKEEGKEKYRPIFFSSNAVTLSNKIQIVARFYGKPEVIHENYDFVHCTNYWKSWDRELVFNQRALESILEKRLYYVGSKYPLCSVIRMRKFIKRGWEISAGEILKMIINCQQFDLKDRDTLEDQLTGVDSAYFGILISAIDRKLDEDSSFEITNSYIADVIDRIF